MSLIMLFTPKYGQIKKRNFPVWENRGFGRLFVRAEQTFPRASGIGRLLPACRLASTGRGQSHALSLHFFCNLGPDAENIRRRSLAE
jgi:hypothetical protein